MPASNHPSNDGTGTGGMTLVPLNEFEWTDDYSYHRILTCRNHPTARYSTKNPFSRSLFVQQIPDGEIERTPTGECTCPLGDLVVIRELSQSPYENEGKETK